jgi:hypothetical protein
VIGIIKNDNCREKKDGGKNKKGSLKRVFMNLKVRVKTKKIEHKKKETHIPRYKIRYCKHIFISLQHYFKHLFWNK